MCSYILNAQRREAEEARLMEQERKEVEEEEEKLTLKRKCQVLTQIVNEQGAKVKALKNIEQNLREQLSIWDPKILYNQQDWIKRLQEENQRLTESITNF